MAVLVCTTMRPLIVVLLAAQALSQELNSTLHSSLYGVRVAYVDEMVIFTCVVRGSNSMTWTSKEYIGAGLQLNIGIANPVGARIPAVENNETVAEVIRSVFDEIIVSRLTIRIRRTYPFASVQCHNVNANSMVSTSFRLDGAASVRCDRGMVCRGETVTCVCSTANSDMLTWMTNGSEITFMSSDSLQIRRDGGDSSTTAVLTETSNTNGVQVIMSNLTVRVPMGSSDTEVVLTCANVDRIVTEAVILPVDEYCPSVLSDQITTPPGNEAQRGSCSTPITTAVVIVVFILLAILIVVSIAEIVLLYLIKYKPLKVQCDRVTKENIQKDGKLKDNEKELNGLRASVKDNEAVLEELRRKKDEEIQKKEENITELNKEIEEKKKQIMTLEALDKENLKKIRTKEEEIFKLTKEASNGVQTKLGLLQTLEDLKRTKGLLEAEVKRLREQLAPKSGAKGKKVTQSATNKNDKKKDKQLLDAQYKETTASEIAKGSEGCKPGTEGNTFEIDKQVSDSSIPKPNLGMLTDQKDSNVKEESQHSKTSASEPPQNLFTD